jgi:hypothetical protein
MSADTRLSNKGVYNERAGRVHMDGFVADGISVVSGGAVAFLTTGERGLGRLGELPAMP